MLPIPPLSHINFRSLKRSYNISSTKRKVNTFFEKNSFFREKTVTLPLAFFGGVTVIKLNLKLQGKRNRTVGNQSALVEADVVSVIFR